MDEQLDASRPWPMPCGGAGVLRPGPRCVRRTLAWTALLFALMIAALFATQLPVWLPALRRFAMAWALAVPLVALGGYALAVRLGERRPVTELALARAPRDLALGVVTGFAFIALTLLLLWACGLYQVRLGVWRHPWHDFVFDAYISAVVEELAFRAVLLRLLAGLVGPMPAWLLSAACFGLAHAGHASPVAMAEIVIDGGLLFGLLFMTSGRLWLPMGAHAAYDFTEWSLMGVGDDDGFLAIAPARGFPDWLTGGTFGPDGSVVAAVVGVSVMCAWLSYGRPRAIS